MLNKDFIGKKIGFLTIIDYADKRNGKVRVWCKCDCGKTIKVFIDNLKREHTRSCGCKKGSMISKSKITHGKTHTKLAHIYNQMKARCYYKKNPAYKNYGGRGIKICNEWLDKENGFMSFYNWAINNGYKEGLTIDRIDNNSNYEPNNCRWATYYEQANNKRNNRMLTYNGETYTITQWARKLGITYGSMYRRIKKGLTGEMLFHKGKIDSNIKRRRNEIN